MTACRLRRRAAGTLLYAALAFLAVTACALSSRANTAASPTASPTATVPAPSSPTATPLPEATATPMPQPSPQPTATPGSITRTLGTSAGGWPMVATQFGRGPTDIVFIGGIHGGYEWNTILLAYQAIDYFLAHPADVPPSVTLTIIPSANPDGQAFVTGGAGRFGAGEVAVETTAGRFNDNGVDLNRNWDCQWAPAATWRDQLVSGGERPFSEPESVVLRDFLLDRRPAAVVFWHSAAGGVFAAGCGTPYGPSVDLAYLYGEVAGYPVYEQFTSYAVTGDAGDWLALQEIPAISVELRTHEDVDWRENLAGMLALLRAYDNVSP